MIEHAFKYPPSDLDSFVVETKAAIEVRQTELVSLRSEIEAAAVACNTAEDAEQLREATAQADFLELRRLRIQEEIERLRLSLRTAEGDLSIEHRRHDLDIVASVQNVAEGAASRIAEVIRTIAPEVIRFKMSRVQALQAIARLPEPDKAGARRKIEAEHELSEAVRRLLENDWPNELTALDLLQCCPTSTPRSRASREAAERDLAQRKSAEEKARAERPLNDQERILASMGDEPATEVDRERFEKYLLNRSPESFPKDRFGNPVVPALPAWLEKRIAARAPKPAPAPEPAPVQSKSTLKRLAAQRTAAE